MLEVIIWIVVSVITQIGKKYKLNPHILILWLSLICWAFYWFMNSTEPALLEKWWQDVVAIYWISQVIYNYWIKIFYNYWKSNWFDEEVVNYDSDKK
jgi:hypothetical protein